MKSGIFNDSGEFRMTESARPKQGATRDSIVENSPITPTNLLSTTLSSGKRLPKLRRNQAASRSNLSFSALAPSFGGTTSSICKTFPD
jgi:hypothetical protein